MYILGGLYYIVNNLYIYIYGPDTKSQKLTWLM